MRLDLDKAVKARKEQIRVEIVTEHSTALQAHVDSLNKTLGARLIAYPAASFGEAIKGKRTLASIREACGVVLAEAKITVSQQAERLTANRAALLIDGRDWFHLFPDFAQVGAKPAEDFDALLQLRIGKHQEAERLAEAARQRAAEQAQAAIQQAQEAQQSAAKPCAPLAPMWPGHSPPTSMAAPPSKPRRPRPGWSPRRPPTRPPRSSWARSAPTWARASP